MTHLTSQEIATLISTKIERNFGKEIKEASKEQIFISVALVVRDLYMEKFIKENNFDSLYIAYKNIFFKNTNKETYLLDSTNNIFTGTRNNLKYYNSLIYSLYDSKMISLSIDRKIKEVSIMSGRKNEGPFKSHLFVDTSNIKVVKPIKKNNKNLYTVEEAVKESNRCLQCTCLQCVKGCAFLQNFNYPKKLVREIYNNLAIAIGTHTANKLINTCNLCKQCAAICPNGLDMAEVCMLARKIMVKNKKMPKSAFEFAILDMEFSNSENYFLAKNQAKYKKSKYAFFPGCQLAASEPELTEYIYKDLCKKMEGGVGIILSCCNIIAKWAGEEKIFKKHMKFLIEQWIKLSKPILIVACPTCFKILKENTNINLIGIWDIFLKYNFNFKKNNKKEILIIHDSCTIRNEKNIHNSIRKLLKNLNYKIKDIKYSKKISPCCGFGGLTLFSDKILSKKINSFRISQTKDTFLTYCINCRDLFLNNKKKAIHLLELLYKNKVKNIRKKFPTWSERQNNRINLKDNILKIKKNNNSNNIIKLVINDEIKKIINERMITEKDIKETILYGEKNNIKFFDKNKKFYITSYKPKNVTFWIIYKYLNKNTYEIINSYSHRMTIE